MVDEAPTARACGRGAGGLFPGLVVGLELVGADVHAMHVFETSQYVVRARR
jgi:hypothetical protein